MVVELWNPVLILNFKFLILNFHRSALVEPRGRRVQRRVPGSLFVRQNGAWQRTGTPTSKPCSEQRSWVRWSEPDSHIAGGRESPP